MNELQVFNPTTGEILQLDAPTADLANVFWDIDLYIARLRGVKEDIQRVILERMARDARWTLHLEGGVTAEGRLRGQTESWDGAELRGRLLELVEDGTITIEAVDRAVEQVVDFKVKKAGVQALRKLGGRVAAYVDSCCFRSEPQRYVKVLRG